MFHISFLNLEAVFKGIIINFIDKTHSGPFLFLTMHLVYTIDYNLKKWLNFLTFQNLHLRSFCT